MKQKQKILVILGPTASGKSNLAVILAKKFNGEIISADSRQVYRGLNIGTGKITRREMRGIPHHLLFIASPRNIFTVTQWKKMAEKAIADIARRGKLPIICGGTGFYIQAIVDDISIPEVPPNAKLRAILERKTPTQLFAMLSKFDPARAKTIDRYNPRRLIRAIEIAKTLGSVPRLVLGVPSKYEVLQVGIQTDDSTLRARIEKRNANMLRRGLIAEVKKLRAQGVSKKRMLELGFEYSLPLKYLSGNISKNEMLKEMNSATWQYARRQKTWFKRDKRIQWFVPREIEKFKNAADEEKIARIAQKFLSHNPPHKKRHGDKN